MEIKRDSYLNKLIRKKNNGLIKIVTGVRRCGKSYLLFNLFHNHLLEEGVDEEHITSSTVSFISGMQIFMLPAAIPNSFPPI